MSSEKMFSSQTHDWRKLGRALGALAPGVEIQRKAQALTWQQQEEVEARGRRKTELVECWAPCAGYPLAVNPEVNQWEPASGHRVRAQGEKNRAEAYGRLLPGWHEDLLAGSALRLHVPAPKKKTIGKAGTNKSQIQRPKERKNAIDNLVQKLSEHTLR
jgi:hypothetical protein